MVMVSCSGLWVPREMVRPVLGQRPLDRPHNLLIDTCDRLALFEKLTKHAIEHASSRSDGKIYGLDRLVVPWRINENARPCPRRGFPSPVMPFYPKFCLPYKGGGPLRREGFLPASPSTFCHPFRPFLVERLR